MAIRCAICGRKMPCGKRSCDKRKDAVHERAMTKARPTPSRSMVFVPRSYGSK